VAFLAPEVGNTIGNFYSAFTPLTSQESDMVLGETRLAFLQTLGYTLVLYVVVQTNPLSLIKINHFGSLCLYLSGLGMILLSGFRNTAILAISCTVLSVFLRDRFMGVVRITSALIVIILGSIIISYTNINLPLTAQRTLCFLPGNWDPVIAIDAKDSSDWRYEMWEMAINSDKYIHNKKFGDGFGFMRTDYERGVDMMYGRTSLRADEAKQEMFLLNGDLHSGPVGTIRFVGFAGFALLLPLFYLLFRMAWRLIRKSMQSDYQTIILFICIPIIFLPVFFLFVYGDYRSDLVTVIFSVGLLKCLEKSIKESNVA
jgi:hypothetical protein